jgi:hypothetical protein
LVTVNCSATLFEPTATGPNASEEGVTCSCAAGSPVPVKPTTSGVNPALVDVTVTEPIRVPGAPGENETMKPQLAPLANCVPQPFCDKP